MARQKMYFKYDIPTSVVELVKAVCSDYNRRERAIKFGSITGEVLDRYIFLNTAIDKALECIEAGIRKDMLSDISKKRGFQFSAASMLISKDAYYRRRRKLIYDIAKELALL
jgi:hypothetical protein